MILVERPLPLFRSSLSFLLSSVSTRKKVSLRGRTPLFLFHSFLLDREHALEGHRISSRTSSFAYFISLCKPLGFRHYQSHYDDFPFIFIFSFHICLSQTVSGASVNYHAYLKYFYFFFIINLFGFL